MKRKKHKRTNTRVQGLEGGAGLTPMKLRVHRSGANEFFFGFVGEVGRYLAASLGVRAGFMGALGSLGVRVPRRSGASGKLWAGHKFGV